MTTDRFNEEECEKAFYEYGLTWKGNPFNIHRKTYEAGFKSAWNIQQKRIEASEEMNDKLIKALEGRIEKEYKLINELCVKLEKVEKRNEELERNLGYRKGLHTPKLKQGVV